MDGPEAAAADRPASTDRPDTVGPPAAPLVSPTRNCTDAAGLSNVADRSTVVHSDQRPSLVSPRTSTDTPAPRGTSATTSTSNRLTGVATVWAWVTRKP